MLSSYIMVMAYLVVQMKTWSVALVLCLNIGVDPPDTVKTNPCARKECWIGRTPSQLLMQNSSLKLLVL